MIKGYLKWLSPRLQMFTGAHEIRKGAAIAQAAEYRLLKSQVAEQSPGNLACNGYKVYSQNDEDGIIEEIFRRVGGNRTFLEIGVQTGVECNSLYLLLKGWRGTWIEGNARSVQAIGRALGGTAFPPRFQAVSSFVTRGNIKDLYGQARDFVDADEIDFFSLDIDGNDLHVMKDLLDSGARPRILCVEYHAKFPPPVSLTIRYAHDHVWDESDYMGSSLQAFVDLFSAYNYRLITCNIPGINAFFAREDLAHHFPTLTVEQLYQPFRPYLSPFTPAQAPSLAYLRDALAGH
jgi:hypothetical protein